MSELLPQDGFDEALLRHVRPAGYVPPTPKGSYHLVVVGGGPAGLVAALGAAGLGARVALVERGLMGGDCLNWGCVPSKALLASAKVAATARDAARFGVRTGPVEVDFPAVMERMRRIRAELARHDSVAKLTAAGVDVFLGSAVFQGPDRVDVGGVSLRFRRALLATGARAFVPPIPGLSDVPWVDNEGLFQLRELPRRLLVVGGGPIGVEMAQAFARFGSEVTVVDQATRLLPREDPEASEVLGRRLVAEGVRLVLGAKAVRFEASVDGSRVVVDRDGAISELVFDRVLIAVGRHAVTDGLGLEAAGVRAGKSGVETDPWLRTSNPAIYAAGDVAGRHQFTHTADAHARAVVQNALFLPTRRVDRDVVPWATYTDPEVAHVGPAWADLAERDDLTAIRVDGVDRLVCESEEAGFLKVWHDRRGRVVACTAVGVHAGDLMGEATLAVGKGLGTLSSTIHAYPTRAELLKRAGDTFVRTRLTPWVASWIRWWLVWRWG